jgi:sulfide:quinone oxidoreductase
MTPTTASPQARVVVAGGGVAALEVVLALRALAGPTLRLTLLAPEREFVHRPSSVSGPFGFGLPLRVPLEPIAERQQVTLDHGTLASVAPGEHTVRTGDDRAIPYDALVIAVGARSREALPGALTFTGPADVGTMMSLLDRLERDPARHVMFVLPHGVSWPLPLYELAIMTAVELRNRAATETKLTVVTPEREPLWMFGPAASEALRRMLAERGIALLTNARAASVEEEGLRMEDGTRLECDDVVALPTLDGPAVPGLPADAHGFLPVDAHGRVSGTPDVYAAGDATSFPLKQGGLATQQADAVAETIAATVGMLARAPEPFRPVLRGLLLTAGAPLYLRAEVGATGLPEPSRRPASRPLRAPKSEASTRALWWPPGKVAGRYLAPMLSTARPVAVASQPLIDRVPATSPDDDRDEALELTLLLAEEDARLGDYPQAIEALDAAAALAGGELPAEYAEKRDRWLAASHHT